MIQIKSVNPFSRKSKIKCGFCGLTYSSRDYRILWEERKVLYFKIQLPSQKRWRIVCHGCLLQVLKKYYPNYGKIELMIIDDLDNVEKTCEVVLDQIKSEEILSLDFWP